MVTDLAALRQLLDSETGGTTCPSCNMPFDKGKKRKLIDTCGHERCYSCMFRNESCPICARKSQGRRQVMERYTPSPQRQVDQEWQSPTRLPKPPKQPSSLAQSCPTPPHTRRRFFSPKSLRSPFGQRSGRHSNENHVPLSGKLLSHVIFQFAYLWDRGGLRFTLRCVRRSAIYYINAWDRVKFSFIKPLTYRLDSLMGIETRIHRDLNNGEWQSRGAHALPPDVRRGFRKGPVVCLAYLLV